MTQYISKSALVAEMKRLENDEFLCDSYDEATGFQSALRMVQEFIDTLEVKEVDLDSEITLWTNAIPEIRLDDVERLAKYFFELGLKVQKGGKV